MEILLEYIVGPSTVKPFNFKITDLIFTWILKHQVSNANRNRIFRCREAFVNEIVAYSDIVPVLAGMLADDPQLPMPQVLFCDEKIEEKFLAFEDLFFNGFEMAQRDKGLDLKACSLIVKVLHFVLFIP